MATNFYFDFFHNRTEQNLIEDLTIEAIKIYGHDMIYLPRETLERDPIFGEDIITKFKENKLLEMYIESVDGFEGGQDVLAKFGLQITDQASFMVSKRRFQETFPNMVRPLEGDLIYFPLSNSMFEINHVEHENIFYQIGKLYSYRLTVEAFTYSHENFETGNEYIDSIDTDRAPEKELDRADNQDIQKEFNEIKIETGDDNDYPTVDDDHGFNEDDPFGGY